MEDHIPIRWRAIVDWPYEVSSTGLVRRTGRAQGSRPGKILQPRRSKNGYVTVILIETPRRINAYIHRLVATAFIGDPTGLEVNHLNGEKTDNRTENLEIVTRRQNHRHATRAGLKARGERHGNARLSDAQVQAIRALAESGMLHREIASSYLISRQHVSDIAGGRRRAAR